MYNCNFFPTSTSSSSPFQIQPSSSPSNNHLQNNNMMDSFSSMMLDDDSITSSSNNNNLMEDISSIIEYGANLFASSNLPLSPPTVIIPSGGSLNNNNSHTTPANSHHHNNNNNNSNVIVTPSGVGGSVGDFGSGNMLFGDFDQVERVETMLELDTRSVLRAWDEYVDNNNINNNNININNNYTTNNNNTINNIHHNNSSNNINNNNIVNIQPSDEQDAQDLLNLINSNNTNNNNTGLITQSYLGSVLANCTSIQGLPSNTIKRSIHQHSKSPSLGSSSNNNHTTNGSNSSSNRGIRKGGHQRSHSVQAACAQAITYTNSMMHKKMNGQSVAAGFNNSNMNAGLGSPSVTSSNYSSVAVMSPANVSSNSFANQVMYNNGYNNQSFASAQCSPVLSNQPQVPSGSNKRGKIPLHRQDKSQQANLMNNQHSKGLLVDANPNDRPVKMQQSKICDSGIKIQIEDGINKNKKDTGLQFHTCTFK